jgi:Glycosyltransferase family 9 (heptosyltransferase)
MNYALVSRGGIGDLVVHADVVRQALERLPPPSVCFATAPASEIGRHLLPDLQWATPASFEAASILLGFDAVVELQWFTTIFAMPKVRTRLIPDAELYDSFEASRVEGATALAGHFERGLSNRSILCRSWGFDADEKFIALDVRSKGRSDAPYVVVSNGADRPWPVAGRQTKQLPRSLFSEIVRTAMDRLPDFNFSEVGAERDSKSIGGTRDLRGTTTLTELLEILNSASAVVCIEGAMAHLCAALGRSAVVLIGPTSETHYGHRLHTYIRSGFCSPCAWSRIDWYATCVKNLQAVCMSAFDPARVAETIAAVVVA